MVRVHRALSSSAEAAAQVHAEEHLRTADGRHRALRTAGAAGHKGTEVLPQRFARRAESAASWNWLNDPAETGSSPSSDVRERSHWDDYRATYGQTIRATASPPGALHGTVVPADNKWYLRTVVVAAIVRRHGEMDLPTPGRQREHKLRVQSARTLLEQERPADGCGRASQHSAVHGLQTDDDGPSLYRRPGAAGWPESAPALGGATLRRACRPGPGRRSHRSRRSHPAAGPQDGWVLGRPLHPGRPAPQALLRRRLRLDLQTLTTALGGRYRLARAGDMSR